MGAWKPYGVGLITRWDIDGANTAGQQHPKSWTANPVGSASDPNSAQGSGDERWVAGHAQRGHHTLVCCFIEIARRREWAEPPFLPWLQLPGSCMEVVDRLCRLVT